MDTLSAFDMGQAHRNDRSMVFDWHKAARRIRETGAQHASAGLRSDWEWTGGQIFHDGKPVPEQDTYTFLASTWAVPELAVLDGPEPCWTWKDETDWDASTYWPASALDILNGEA